MSENDISQSAGSDVDTEAQPDIAYVVKEVKQQEGSVLRYCIEVERSVYDAKLDEILGNLRKTVVVDGFRRGKAPVNLLKNRYGKEAQDDAVKDLAANVTEQIIKKDALDVIGEPALNDSKTEAGQPVYIEVDIDVHPKVDVQGYTGLTADVQVQPVTDDLVEKQLEYIRDANATYEVPASGEKAFEKGDGLTADIVVTEEGGKKIDAMCRENAFLRDPFTALDAELANELIGKKAGDVVTKSVAHASKNKAGEDVTHSHDYAVTVKEVKVKIVPSLDDEFAKDMGDFSSLADLRKRILDDLVEQADRQKRQQAMEQLLGKIVEANAFDAPRKVVAAQEYQTIMHDSQRLQQMGMDFASMGETTEAYLKSARANSERFVKSNILVNAIAAKEKLEVTDEDVDKEIERQAQSSGRKPLAIRAKLEAEKRLDALKKDLVVQKVENYLMENNTINVSTPTKEEEK